MVLECDGKLRHVQFKGSTDEAKASFQKVNVALGRKPSGCIVWMRSTLEPHSRRLKLKYLFFGNGPGQALPSVENFPLAKHSKGDSTGKKKERAEIRKVRKSLFREVSSTRELIKVLFGLTDPSWGQASVVEAEQKMGAKHEWCENDDIVALYLHLFGSDDLPLRIPEIGDRLGMGAGSLRMRIGNFRAIDGHGGLGNAAIQSQNLRGPFKNRERRTAGESPVDLGHRVSA